VTCACLRVEKQLAVATPFLLSQNASECPIILITWMMKGKRIWMLSCSECPVGWRSRFRKWLVLLYSVCRGDLGQNMCTWHCRIACKQCGDWTDSHCKGCNKCQYWASIPCSECSPPREYASRMEIDCSAWDLCDSL
jgi:hypothetical protein